MTSLTEEARVGVVGAQGTHVAIQRVVFIELRWTGGGEIKTFGTPKPARPAKSLKTKTFII